MKQTILNSRLGLLRFQCSNGYEVSIGVGAGHYSDNYSMSYNSVPGPTATMEVAIFNDRNGFVVLPHDVAGYVPVYSLGDILDAVEGRDWERVCFLCNQDTNDHSNKFPERETTLSKAQKESGEKTVTDTLGRDWIVNENK